MAKNSKDSIHTNPIALSQDEVDKVMKGHNLSSAKKDSNDINVKIQKLKEKTKSVGEILEAERVELKNSETKKNTEKLSVYFEGKLYGTAILSLKNGKKIVELLTIKKQK